MRAIPEFPVPKNGKEASRCIGLLSYFRRFVSDFARIARPLHALTKKDAVFKWTDECTNAFTQLKRTLTEAPVLSIYNPKRETELHTDAAKVSVPRYYKSKTITNFTQLHFIPDAQPQRSPDTAATN